MTTPSPRELREAIDASTTRRESAVANHRRDQALSRLRLTLFGLVSAVVATIAYLLMR